MKRPLTLLAFTVLSCLFALSASAQTSNPSAVTFDHVDFATAAHYDGGYFALLVKADNTCDLLSTPAVAPMATDNLGKPATTTGLGMSAPLVAKPIGCYVYKVRALDASGLYSDWSLPSDPLVKRPATVGKPVVK
jgi:hypothetical protein